MKTNRMMLLVLLAIIFLFVDTQVVLAAEDKTIDELEPVIYEKLKFKKNTDYLHDEKKTEIKNTIPEKQFNIYFDGRKKLPNRSDTSFLFQTSIRGEKSTVAAKSSELNLFMDKSKGEKQLPDSQFNSYETASNNTRTMIFLAIIVIGLIALFIVVLPKLVQPSETSINKG
ncbi:type VII secretion protein EssA [Psychrobacillus sp. OK032]|uniref:type VII secretion protein EssA n=1 Tax=Psychrobacillus sp. OK032 TaxID=1884358 RepID=UPI0008CC85FA|nr:type VII secretion protein EssA [Psychrobacillus sp. OK032]SER67508.1 type VII secretion protein EssA [Psychrobacillus sp. OK032]